jgi:pyruvate dehydrogenase E2 component (dihydrolipoamide acetyltransferase)
MTVPVPDIGDFKEVEVIEVLVKPGDSVTKEQSLITLESDKATMEIPSPSAGVVKEISIKVGDKVSKGAAILVLDSKEVSTQETPKAAKPTPSAVPAPTREPHHPPGAARAARRNRRQAARQPVGAEICARARGRAHSRSGSGPKRPHPARRRAGVREGRAAEGAAPRGEGGQGGALPFNLPAWPEVDFAKFGPVETKPLARIQKLSGPYLHRNWISIPHVTQFDEADITDLEAFRKAQTVETEKKGFKLTMLAFMIKACVTALRQYPQFNPRSTSRARTSSSRSTSTSAWRSTRRAGWCAGGARRRPQGRVRHRARALGHFQAGARRQAQARRHAGRHVLDLEPGRHRRHRVHADHQRARSRDPRRSRSARRARCGHGKNSRRA